MKRKKICVLGLGYMGLPTASLLATNGYQVIGVDINSRKIESIKKRQIPFNEPGLKELVFKAMDSENLNVQSEMTKADVFIIAVPTPITPAKKADLSYVVSAAEMIAPFLEKDNLVILESTVSPETCTKILIPILNKSGLKVGKDYLLSHCPERAIPGNTMHELVNNDRIIGGINGESKKITKKIYSSFVKGDIYLTDTTTAETIKLMENTFRDINIALANEFAKIAEEIGIDIWEAIDLANKHPRVNILKPGPGVGGHCIAIDPWFLTEHSKNAKIIRTARDINDTMPGHVISLAEKMLKKIKNPTITILGVAYKPNVDDARETPAKQIIALARRLGWDIKIHDFHVKESEFPGLATLDEAVKGSDCLILVTNHQKYKNIDYNKIKSQMRRANILDTRSFLNSDELEQIGFNVKVLGKNKHK